MFVPEMSAGDLTAGQTGRAGEALAMYNLEMFGVQAEIIRTRGCDLWCMAADGMLFTAEVKTCSVPFFNDLTCREKSYKYNIRSTPQRASDVHVFVALDIMGALFVPTSELPQGGGKTYKARHLDRSLTEPSLQHCLSLLKDNKKAA